MFLVPMRKQFAENPNKSYHVYKVIVVLHVHIYNKILVIRLEGHPATKNKSVILIKFCVLYIELIEGHYLEVVVEVYTLRIVYLSIVYLQVPATVTAKATN